MHNSVEGSKRQLPSWMVQKVGASHGSNSDNVVETNCHMEKRDVTANAGNVTKRMEGIDHKRESSKRKSNLNAKREVKRRRNLSQKDGSGDNIIQKKKRKRDRCRDRVQKSSINIKNPSHGSCDVYQAQVSSDDDVELTIEDLMAIAEEYVKDYENKERQETSSRLCESRWQILPTSESGTALDSPCESKKSSSSAREALHNSTLTTTGQLIATSTSQTGHPAQDMLDLFLGPLLRKPPEKEEKNKSIVESLEFTHEFTRQSQHELVGEEMPPLTKKRNTLKDKVAMFLD